MMRIVIGVLLALAIAAGISGISAYSYHLGFAQGAAQTAAPGGQAPVPPGGPYPMQPWGYGFHGPFGFGVFGFLWPLLWIVLFVFLFRALFRGPCGHGPRSGGGPEWLEEWHRRQHEPKSQPGTV